MRRPRPLSAAFAALLCGMAVLASGCSLTTADKQDISADVLKTLDTAHNKAVELHDATPICPAAPVCDPPDVHAKHRTILQTSAAALRSAWAGLIAWKSSSDPAPPPGTFCPVVKALPDLETLAVNLGAVKKADADKWLPTIQAAASIVAGSCP
jgi:hypothetical protein